MDDKNKEASQEEAVSLNKVPDAPRDESVSDFEAGSERDLDAMEEGLADLVNQGAFTPKQAEEIVKNNAKARRSFRDLSPTQRKKIITRQVQFGKRIMGSTMSGNMAVIVQLELDHGVLKNFFSQFVPIFDRALVNMSMFGDEVFSKANHTDRRNALTKGALEFYEAAHSARVEADKIVEEHKLAMDEIAETYVSPVVPTPALVNEVHIHSPVSMNHLKGYTELDKLLTLTGFLLWNGVRTQKEVNAVVRPLMQMALGLGRRGFLTQSDFLRLQNEKEKTLDEPTAMAA